MGTYLRGKSYYIDFHYEGKRYTEKVGPVSKTVAEEKLNIKKAEVIRGQWKPKVVRTSFEKFKEEYLKYSLANKKSSTARRDIIALVSLQKFFGGKSISEINPFLIEKYKQRRKEDGVSPRTINIEVSCLGHMFNMAIKWSKANQNPVRGIKLLKEPESSDRILSPEEEIRLLEVIRTSKRAKYLEQIVITALATGMRKFEILRLPWSNVDLVNRFITVEGTKSGYIRKIPMGAKLTETLSQVKRESHGEFVFAYKSGMPYNSIRTAWDNALSKAGIEGLVFHSLRHTFGSRLGMAAIDVRTIQELMGHRSLAMVMKYSHPTPEHKRRAIETLERVTTFFTTQGVDEACKKVVNIGNR